MMLRLDRPKLPVMHLRDEVDPGVCSQPWSGLDTSDHRCGSDEGSQAKRSHPEPGCHRSGSPPSSLFIPTAKHRHQH